MTTESHNIPRIVKLDDGKDHKIQRLEARHLEVLEQTVRQKEIDAINKYVPEDSPDKIDKLISAGSRAIDFVEVIQHMRSPSGNLEAIWLCLRDHAQELTLEQVREYLVKGQKTSTMVMQIIRDEPPAPKRETTTKKTTNKGAKKKARSRTK